MHVKKELPQRPAGWDSSALKSSIAGGRYLLQPGLTLRHEGDDRDAHLRLEDAGGGDALRRELLPPWSCAPWVSR